MRSKQTRRMRRQFSLKERFRYWFDNRVAKGSLLPTTAYALPRSNVFGGYHQISSRRATTVR